MRRFWFIWILAPIGLLLLSVIAGVWLLVGRAAPPLHPNPESIPSVADTAAATKFLSAVERGRQVVRASLSEENLPGLSVAVGVDGDIAWAEGFGWADVNAQVPVTPETRFWIGTASTMLTSVAVGRLVEQGRLTLDEPIQTHVPEFPVKQWPVTLRDLMAHVAGVSTDSGSDGPLFRRRCARPGEALQNFADSDLLFEPGTQFRHSKYGWILVSAAVEAAAGQPFLTVMREQVFQPLGMEATGADSTAEENPDHIGEPAEDAPFLTLIQDFILEPVWGKSLKKSERATFYTLGLGPDPVFRYRLHRMRSHNLSCYAGSMAFLSTPSDLVRFALAITNGNILQPATVQVLQSPRQLSSGQDTGYGLGWDLETVTLNGIPRQAAGHNGELLGRGVMSLMAFREPGIVVAVTSNASYVDTSALAVKIAEVFAGRR